MTRRKDSEAEVKRLKKRFLQTFAQECRRDAPDAVPKALEEFRGSTIFPLTVDAQGNDLPLAQSAEGVDWPIARASEGIPPAPPRGTPVSLAQIGEAIDRLSSRPFTVKRNDIAVSFIVGDQERIAENARRVAARSRRGESK